MEPTGELDLQLIPLKKAALVFRAVNNKLRQQILQVIHTEKKITVTAIYIKLRLEQSVASQHLAILRKASIVNTERNGKHIYYSINHKRLQDVHEYAGKLVNLPHA